MYRRVKLKRSRKQSLYRTVRIACNTAVQLDSRISKRILCSLAYSSADKRIDIVQLKEACKRSVSAAERGDNAFAFDAVILDLIHLEHFRMAEMLKNLSVLISYRYFHLFLFSVRKGCLIISLYHLSVFVSSGCFDADNTITHRIQPYLQV